MADETTVPEPIEVTLCSVEPNNCALEEPVNLSLEFNTNRELLQARWVIMFVADQVHTKKIIMLGETPLQDYAIGVPHTMAFTAKTIDVQGVARHVLTNVGLLQAVLYAGQEEILQISMVTQVSQEADGVLVRSIFNPLE